jgi:hypothetical protein
MIIGSVPVTGPVVAQRVGRGIALLFQDRGTRRRLVVSSTPRPLFTPWKDPVPILQEAGWAPGPVWTGGKSRPTGIRSPDRPARSQSLYRLSCRPTSAFSTRRNMAGFSCRFPHRRGIFRNIHNFWKMSSLLVQKYGKPDVKERGNLVF